MEVVVEFEYEALHDDELTLHPGDIIKNVRYIEEEGWMEGELNGRRGVFPDNFVKEVKKETKNDLNRTTSASKRRSGNVANLVNRMSTIVPTGGFQPLPPAASKKPKRRQCKVLFEYQPLNEDELELRVGDVVDILEEVEEGWWSGSFNGKSGLFPSNFVQVLEAAGEETEPNTTQAEATDGSVPEASTTPTSPQPASGNDITPQPLKVPRVGFGDIFKGGSVKLKPTAIGDQPVPLLPSAAKPAHPNMADSQRDDGDIRAKDAGLLVPPVKELCKVTFSYEAKNEDELSLKEGETVRILSKDTGEPGWWRGEVGGSQGVFPNNFVTVVPETDKQAPAPRGSVKSTQKQELDQKLSKPLPPSKTPAPKPDVPSVDKRPHSIRAQDREKPPADRPSKPPPPAVPHKKPIPPPPKKLEKPLTSSPSSKPNGEIRSIRPEPDVEPVLPTKTQPADPLEKPSDSDQTPFDEIPLTLVNLTHPTTERPRFRGRRLPAHLGGGQLPTEDENTEKPFKLDKEDGAKLKAAESRKPSINSLSQSPPLHRPAETKPSPAAAAPSSDSKVQLELDGPSSQVDELKTQIKELLLSVERLKVQQMKEIAELRGELDEERLKRVTLQMEVEELKRAVHLT